MIEIGGAVCEAALADVEDPVAVRVDRPARRDFAGIEQAVRVAIRRQRARVVEFELDPCATRATERVDRDGGFGVDVEVLAQRVRPPVAVAA